MSYQPKRVLNLGAYLSFALLDLAHRLYEALCFSVPVVNIAPGCNPCRNLATCVTYLTLTAVPTTTRTRPDLWVWEDQNSVSEE
jgi:hypothetical protein